MNKTKLIFYAVIAAAVIWGGLCVYSWIKGVPVVELFHQEKKMERTATILRSVNSITRWVFLTVEDEELVGREHWNGDVVKIFPLEYQLGIEIEDSMEWVRIEESNGIRTAYLHLPPIRILNPKGIDVTKTIHVWGNAGRSEQKDMEKEAEHNAQARALSPANIKQSRKNAKEHFTNLFKALGCDDVKIEWLNK